jgi:hypothetical protein
MWVTAEFQSERGDPCRDHGDRDHADDDIQRSAAMSGLARVEGHETWRRGFRLDTVELVPEPAVKSRTDVNHV